MKQNRFLLLILAVIFTCGTAAASDDAGNDGTSKSLTVRAFSFKYKDADKAAAAIKPLMTSEGSISIKPGANSLVVTDRADVIRQIAATLAQFDTPARSFKLVIRLVSAARVEHEAKMPDELRDIAPQLGMLRFNSYETLGTIDVQGKEGDPGVIDLASGYRGDFRFGEYDAASDSIKINDLHLSKLSGAQKDQLTSLLKTSMNLKIGRIVVLGASKVPDSQRALMIVLSATR